LPKFLTKQLAEDIGIHIGDGCLSVQEKKDHAIFCSGNYNDDKIYLDSYVAPLKENLYGIMPSKLRKKNEYCLIVRSKTICKFYSEILKLPIGSKNEITIPDLIINSEYIMDCLRGIIDTDFSLAFKNKGNSYNYPTISAFFKSKRLVKQLESILKNIGFSVHTEYDYKRYDKRTDKIYTSQCIYLNGKKNLNLWLKLIGTNNPKHYTKYLIWKKYDSCEPYTTVNERMRRLN
jgi:hypothetical protein